MRGKKCIGFAVEKVILLVQHVAQHVGGSFFRAPLKWMGFLSEKPKRVPSKNRQTVGPTLLRKKRTHTHTFCTWLHLPLVLTLVIKESQPSKTHGQKCLRSWHPATKPAQQTSRRYMMPRLAANSSGGWHSGSRSKEMCS